MLLCLGLALLTVGNIQPRFRLVNRAGLHVFCPCSSRVPMCKWIQAVLYLMLANSAICFAGISIFKFANLKVVLTAYSEL